MKAEDALAAIELAARKGFRLLGLEGFIVGPEGVYPAMSRIADFSADATAGLATAERLLRGEWSRPPTDVHPDASGLYMIDVCVADDR